MNNKREHWENIYTSKKSDEMSWTQNHPTKSLAFIQKANISKDSAIIDIGGGESQLVDHLLKLGYTDLTVLDISEQALLRAQERLGKKAKNVNWICSDITEFKPDKKYILWHDRAVFHFLKQDEIMKYLEIASNYVTKNLIISTFSKEGPMKCSGLSIQQYNAEDLAILIHPEFHLLVSESELHTTPFNTNQAFMYCLFEKAMN